MRWAPTQHDRILITRENVAQMHPQENSLRGWRQRLGRGIYLPRKPEDGQRSPRGWGRDLKGTRPAHTWTLDFQPPDCEMTNSCC